MRPSQFFLHCPRCGAKQAGPPSGPCLVCAPCGFQYYFNPTVAVVVFIRGHGGKYLFIRRAKEPAKGRLAPPGGFIDIGETAEEAACREVREEVGLELTEIEYLSGQPNDYPFAGVTYAVLDLCFTATVAGNAGAPALNAAPDEVAACLWLDPFDVSPSDMAFPSMAQALDRLQRRLRGS